MQHIFWWFNCLRAFIFISAFYSQLPHIMLTGSKQHLIRLGDARHPAAGFLSCLLAVPYSGTQKPVCSRSICLWVICQLDLTLSVSFYKALMCHLYWHGSDIRASPAQWSISLPVLQSDFRQVSSGWSGRHSPCCPTAKTAVTSGVVAAAFRVVQNCERSKWHLTQYICPIQAACYASMILKQEPGHCCVLRHRMSVENKGVYEDSR